MSKLRPYVLPIALVLGLLLHRFCTMLSPAVPYVIFAILLLTFCAVDLRKLRLTMIDVWIMLFQLVVSTGSYAILLFAGASHIVAEGVLIGVLCPVASSVAVISCMLGANRETVTTYTIVGNLMVAVAAPAIFTIIGVKPELSFIASFWLILKKIAPTLGLPFFIALGLQLLWPKAKQTIAKINGLGFYLWSLALLLTLGQTIDFIILHGRGNWSAIVWLGVASLSFCIAQFGLGRLLGRRYGDTVSGGQLLGQKNTAMGIWMANTFLHPLASVFMAFYSIFQNVFNSWQLWHYNRKK
ncbi:MAG: transporter [Bacteroidales bacterium]|nr:transporter [Bacteroidales bacterium]